MSLVVDRYDEEWTRLACAIVQGTPIFSPTAPSAPGRRDLLRDKYAQYRALGLDRTTATVIRISPERAMSWRWDDPERRG